MVLLCMKPRLVLFALLLAGATSACSSDDLLSPCPRDQICVDGTAQFIAIEGGFWAIRGDDKVTYDPVGGLPADFRQPGLPVHLRALERRDLGSFHMVGPIVEIISIRRRDD